VVHELVPPSGHAVAVEWSVNTALDDVPDSVAFTTTAEASGGAAFLTLHATYPPGRGAFGYAGVTRVVVSGSAASVTAHGTAVRIAGATAVLLLTGLARHETPTTRRPARCGAS
jgi:hypothetical protein